MRRAHIYKAPKATTFVNHMNLNWQMERFIVRHRMKQKIVELSKKYPVADIKPISRVNGQQQLLDWSNTTY